MTDVTEQDADGEATADAGDPVEVTVETTDAVTESGETGDDGTGSGVDDDRTDEETESDETADDAEDRVVLVTGAASGIGRATVERFHERGWTVWATDVATERLTNLPEGVHAAELDVTDADDRERVVARIVEASGRLDCLVNNAGFAVPGPVEDVPVERGREQFEILVHGPHGLVRETLPHLRERGGTVVTVTSVLGRTALPGAGLYSAAKFAAEGLTDALRMELADTDADAVAVEPAWVETAFERTALDELDALDRTDVYDEVYDRYERGVLDGGPLAVSPDRVAEAVVTAAEASAPESRYPVGAVAQAVAAARYLPDPIADRVTLTVSKLVAAVS